MQENVDISPYLAQQVTVTTNSYMVAVSSQEDYEEYMVYEQWALFSLKLYVEIINWSV